MKRGLYITLIFIATYTMGYARTIRDFFISEPGGVFMTLTENARLDMLDYYDSGRIVDTENQLNGTSKLKNLTPNFLSVQLAESVDVEMIMQPISKKDTIIIVNVTYQIPAPDGKLQFFSSDWDELDARKFIKEPTMSDFINTTDKKLFKKILESIDFPVISYAIDAETATITATQNLDKHLSKEEYEKISKHLISSIKYTFDKKKYKIAK